MPPQAERFPSEDGEKQKENSMEFHAMDSQGHMHFGATQMEAELKAAEARQGAA